MKNISFYFFFSLVFFSFVSFAARPTATKSKALVLSVSNNNSISSDQSLNQSFAGMKSNLSSFTKSAGDRKSLNATIKSAVPSTILIQNKLNSSLPQLLLNKSATNNIKKISWNSENGTPRLIEVHSSKLQKTGAASSKLMESAAKVFLADNKSILKINDPQNEFLLKYSLQDNLGLSHLKFSQTYNGIEVWGKEIIVHLDAAGNIISLNGSYEPTPVSVTDSAGAIDQSKAVYLAENDLQLKSPIENLPPKFQNIFGYNGPAAKKIIWYDENHKGRLAWHVEIRSGLSRNWNYFIDASTGAILNRYNNVCYDGTTTASSPDLNGINRTFGTYQVGSTYYLIDASLPMYDAVNSVIPDNPLGAVMTVDIRNHDLTSQTQIYYCTSGDNQWTDASSVSAQSNAIKIYQYFLNTYNRKSIDDKNMTIISIAHVTENNSPMENAFWNQAVMCYGDGNKLFKPLAGALDVAAHEMTHGVTQYSANLEYQNQSGALNESWSDVFGALVDSLNWTMGELIIKDFASFPTGALRDFADPHNGGTPGSLAWQPAKMSEYLQLPNDETGDNGGVHVNSGIPNHAFYFTASAIGRYKAGQIWYRALTVYLTRTSQFIDARIATEKAAEDLYGASSSEVQAVKNSWDNVEIYEGGGTTPPPASQVTGTDWVLLTSADKSTLYMAKTTVSSDADIFTLSNTQVLNRPAVTDASGIILYIDGNNRLKALHANPSNPQEVYIDTNAVWRGVAAGPGLNSIALISIFQDTSIYYFDFVNNISKSFKIVSQAFDGQDTKTALYADEMSFDPTGRYILFDCYNEINKSDGSKLSYWNINLLDVQQGSIQSVFPPQSTGIEIGNPSFSKTSPFRFTFDYIDSQTDLDYVMAADFNTGVIGLIAGPFSSNSLSILGYPTYSGDDRTIAYHTTQMVNGNTVEAIEQIPLKENMLEANGSSQPYVYNATFPNWFVIGTRTTDVQTNPNAIPAAFALAQNYPNPFNPSTRIEFSLPQRAVIKIRIFDLIGREVLILANGAFEAGKHEIEFKPVILPSGVYFYNLTSGAFSITKKMILLK